MSANVDLALDVQYVASAGRDARFSGRRDARHYLIKHCTGGGVLAFIRGASSGLRVER